MSERLCIVMPVYNEREAIGAVLKKWDAALSALGIDYEIRPYNDGSRDDSLQVMRRVAASLESVSVRDKPNGGHGNTILTGYREAAADRFDWVFQIDSDDEMGPEKFDELWSRRNDFDFLVGIRDGRVQALPRKIISLVSRLCVRIFYGKSIWDVNTPYRLMRVSVFKEFFDSIPLNTFAPNVILSGLAARHKVRCFETRVPQHDRTTGEVSIKKWKLLKAAAKSFWQTISFAFRHASFKDWTRLCFWGMAWFFAAFSIVIGVKNGLREFDFQWDPAKLLMMGENPYLYSLENREVLYDGFMSKHVDANQLPSCLLLLAPWTLLPQLLANQVWAFCNLIFSVIFLVYLYKSFFYGSRKDLFFLVPLLLFSGTPWRVLVGNGQHLMFSLAFFMPAYYYAKSGRQTLGGVLLALSAFKYTTIAPLAMIFVVRKWWKSIVVAAVLHVVATICVSCYLGESPMVLISQSLQVGAKLTGFGSADIASVIRLFWSSDQLMWANIGYGVWGCVMIALLFCKCDDDLTWLSVLAIISNVMFYHRVYDFVSLTFPLVLAISIWGQKGKISGLLLGAVLANIAWTFYVGKILGYLTVREMGVVTFVLEHFLLLLLLLRLYKRHMENKSKLMANDAKCNSLHGN